MTASEWSHTFTLQLYVEINVHLPLDLKLKKKNLTLLTKAKLPRHPKAPLPLLVACF